MADREKLLLVDAHSLFHQAYHAVAPLTTRAGLPTNALFGFTNMLLRLLDDERPAALGLAFDTPEPTFRHLRYPAYKAHRPPAEPELVQQFPLLPELAEAFAWPVLRLPGWEADDILATLAEQARAEWEVYIVTADRDLCQVATEHVTILATQGRGVSDVHRFDPPAVEERFGVPPALLPDWKGLVGDSSDNLPGVRGIGPKTATALLREHGSLEAVLAAAPTLPGKKGEMLVAEADQARLCRELATVRRDAPVPLTPAELRRRPPDEEAAARLLTRLEFGQLQRRLNPRTTHAPPTVDYAPVTDDRTAAQVAEALAEAGTVALAWADEPPGVAVAWAPGRSRFLPLAGGGGGQLALFHDDAADGAARDRLHLALAPLTADVGYVTHDVQRLFDGLGVDSPLLTNLRGDTHLAAWLLDPERPVHPPLTLCGRYLGAAPPDEARGLSEPGAFVACREADLARRLEPRLREELTEQRLLELYRELELPLAVVLARLMARGLALDVAAAEALDAELAAGVAAARAAVVAAAGRSLNLDSPKQLGELLFVELGLPAGRKTKTGWSTDAATLEPLREAHPVVGALLEYRELAKLKSTYTEVLLSRVEPATGRIHTRLNQTGTATGRLSSSAPNLQNIPVRTALGERVRELFVAPPGWLLLAADYSQIELRVLAHESGDPTLIEAFRRGEDIHATAAAAIFGVPPEQILPEMRRQAKVLNFGIAYGIGAHGLAQRLDLDRTTAQGLIDAYFARFPGVKRYATETIARARESGWVQTLFGRRRRLAEIRAAQPQRRQAAERAAINMPIQGAAADIIKRAMLTLEARLTTAGRSRMVLQVHDELLLEVAEGELEAVARLTRTAMEQAASLVVPLEVTVKVGRRWANLEPLAESPAG